MATKLGIRDGEAYIEKVEEEKKETKTKKKKKTKKK